MKTKMIFFILLFTFFTRASNATPVTMDFNGVNMFYSPYTEDGFDLYRTSYDHWHIHTVYNNGGALFAHFGANLLLKKSGGGSFDFTSFDLWTHSTPFTIASDLGDVFNSTTAEIGTYTFDWIGVNEIYFINSSSLYVDNITLNASSVPAPASIVLCGLVLIGFGLARKRQS